MNTVTKQIQEMMSDGVARTGREIAEQLGRGSREEARKIASLVNAMFRNGYFLEAGREPNPIGRDVVVYIRNPDYTPKERSFERRSKDAMKGKSSCSSARLVEFRSPNESGNGYAYKPQPAIRAIVRFGGVSSLENF